eukprot:176246-Rhodomonas_salina.4
MPEGGGSGDHWQQRRSVSSHPAPLNQLPAPLSLKILAQRGQAAGMCGQKDSEVQGLGLFRFGVKGLHMGCTAAEVMIGAADTGRGGREKP